MKNMLGKLKLGILILTFFCFGEILETQAQNPNWNQRQWENYFNSRLIDLDPIEGIWSASSWMELIERGKTDTYGSQAAQVVAIYWTGQYYNVLEISLTPGVQIIPFVGKTFLTKTAADGIYIVELQAQSKTVARANAILTNKVFLDFSYEFSKETISEVNNLSNLNFRGRLVQKNELIKIFPR